MAVIAATIAAMIARAQLRHNKEQYHHDRWWDTLTWIYDRTVVEKEKREPLPHRVTFSMLTALNNHTKSLHESRHGRKNPIESSLQAEAISSIISMFDEPEERTGDGAELSSDPGYIVTDPIAISLLESLRNDVGEIALSSELYERLVRQALLTVSRSMDLDITTRPRGAYGVADFIVRDPANRQIFVDALFVAPQSHGIGKRILDRIFRYMNAKADGPMLIVTNRVVLHELNASVLADLDKALRGHGPNAVSFIEWEGGSTDELKFRLQTLLAAAEADPDAQVGGIRE